MSNSLHNQYINDYLTPSPHSQCIDTTTQLSLNHISTLFLLQNLLQ